MTFVTWAVWHPNFFPFLSTLCLRFLCGWGNSCKFRKHGSTKMCTFSVQMPWMHTRQSARALLSRNLARVFGSVPWAAWHVWTKTSVFLYYSNVWKGYRIPYCWPPRGPCSPSTLKPHFWRVIKVSHSISSWLVHPHLAGHTKFHASYGIWGEVDAILEGFMTTQQGCTVSKYVNPMFCRFERQLLLKQTRESQPDGALGPNEGDMTYMIVATTRMKPILLHFDLRHPVQSPKKIRYTQSRIGYVLLWHLAFACLSSYSRSCLADCLFMKALVSSSISVSSGSRISTNGSWSLCIRMPYFNNINIHQHSRNKGLLVWRHLKLPNKLNTLCAMGAIGDSWYVSVLFYIFSFH